jgi:hypothetical protein
MRFNLELEIQDRLDTFRFALMGGDFTVGLSFSTLIVTAFF